MYSPARCRRHSEERQKHHCVSSRLLSWNRAPRQPQASRKEGRVQTAASLRGLRGTPKKESGRHLPVCPLSVPETRPCEPRQHCSDLPRGEPRGFAREGFWLGKVLIFHTEVFRVVLTDKPLWDRYLLRSQPSKPLTSQLRADRYFTGFNSLSVSRTGR